jgi:hypothetical protein
MGSDGRMHTTLLNMGYWISSGVIYACMYDSHTAFHDWYERLARRRNIKDFVMVRSSFSDNLQLCEADWDMDRDGVMRHFNFRLVHFMLALHDVIVRTLGVVQRHARRRIIREALRARLFSKLAAAKHALHAVLPMDVVDAIIGIRQRALASRAIVVETDAFRARRSSNKIMF